MSARSKHPAQAGFSLIELMVAMAITMTVSAGMLTLLMSTRTNNVSQNLMEQVQDDQRLALTRLIDTVQNAGYFPNPSASSPAIQFVAGTPVPSFNTITFANTGQTLTGRPTTTAQGDGLAVRYTAAGLVAGVGDGVMDCSGSQNTGATALAMINYFWVDTSGNFNCTANGKTVPLASGVSYFQVQYGVDTNGDGAADEYLPASSMVAANWLAVMSVRVTLTFVNPMAGKPGQTSSAATLNPITQIIPVLNQL